MKKPLNILSTKILILKVVKITCIVWKTHRIFYSFSFYFFKLFPNFTFVWTCFILIIWGERIFNTNTNNNVTVVEWTPLHEVEMFVKLQFFYFLCTFLFFILITILNNTSTNHAVANVINTRNEKYSEGQYRRSTEQFKKSYSMIDD